MSRPRQASLAVRLQARRPEIEAAILARAYSVDDASSTRDPAYIAGLKTAVSAALGYGLAGIEAENSNPGPIPGELFAQARHAARSGVTLETVLRRYFTGHALLSDFVMQEAHQSKHFSVEELKALGMTQAMLVDDVVAAIAVEYRREAQQKARSREQRRLDCVRRLLAGGHADTSQLAYDLDLWHTALIAVGKGAESAVRSVAATLVPHVLLIPAGDDTLWAWLGSPRRESPEGVERLAAWEWPVEVRVAMGEPAQGLTGWRFTHEQANAALLIALHGEETQQIRYADVAFLASMLKDEILARSVAELYLDPLASGATGQDTLRQTLHAYFSAQRNVSSTASALGVSRKTVTSRLRAVEQHLGRTLDTCAAELELALRFSRLNVH